ncbi:MAG: hypothetical protein JWL77_6228 [Chthonomonadaceae bacterium]|nr:hypothetical protein [Chthonomonadaceae bacterium]
MSVRITFSFLLAGLLLSCLNLSTLAQQIKRVAPSSKTTFVFRPIHLENVRLPVIVEVRTKHVRHYDQDRIKSLVISGLSIRKGQRVVLSTTTLEDELYWCDVSLYRHRKSGHYLLVIESGGQHDHTQVYYLDPHNFHVRPLSEDIGVIYGDASGLAKGRIVEHCPDQYVDPKPDGFKRRNPDNPEYFSRVWTYHPKSHRFTAGPYHVEK